MIKFLLVRDVKAPKRNTSKEDKPGDAGFDFFVPEKNDMLIADLIKQNSGTYNASWHFTENGFILKPGADIQIPSGVKALIPWNEALMGKNKSGQATKKKLRKGAQVVDASYQGEIFLHLFNDGKDDVNILFGEKIIQLVPVYIDCDEPEIYTINDISAEEFYSNHNSERGAGAKGSTGIF